MTFRPFLLSGLLLTTAAATVQAQTAPAAARPMSQRMTDAFISWHPDSILIGNRKTARWDYEQGLMLKAMERVWQRTGDARYFTYIQKDLDQFVRPDGTIRTYKLEDYNLDNLTTGHVLLTLGQMSVPQAEKYQKAAQLLRKQLDGQPRTKAGGFWHKKIYPNQMWLDGLYMAEPFYAEYSQVFNQPAGFDDIAKQFALIEQNLVDPKTGLMYHGYDESREQQWANKTTGQSPNFWDRGMGWYAMALVDVLDYFPQNHPQRPMLVKAAQRLAPVLAKYQDAKTGTWSLVVDQAARKGNYAEASGSSMFVYFLQKGVRMGYLDKKYADAARKGYDGLLKTFVAETSGALAFNGTVSVGGLGGKPYRNGSYEYYLSEPLRKNDLKGVGPFILASIEMEIAAESRLGKGKTVAVDNYFNHELRQSKLSGQQETWHYTWDDRTHGGFYFWGQQFRDLGAKTTTIATAPTAAALKGVDVYIIVDPDTKKETAKPNFVQPADVQALTKWVKDGGTLVLMANDTSNCEIPRFNTLAAAFGMQFKPLNLNMVKGNEFEQGRVNLPAGNAVFKTAKSAYIKELAPLDVKAPATPLVKMGEHTVIATAKVGKGTVFAVGDPWLYNEYVDGRKIPATFENFNAAKDIATWLLQ
ncbi:glycoside hydrolase family 88/105 protein [Hymenobacter psychrotolerans]|uniref:Unsaturated rhamnogalacturonyl hydrolase n=1 Tax=Hymenobacter psychrotolerans DSM 18569 TaxID=1121959 RepID=A0A1M7DE90_9BACT|nr:glycoside hydrolase family 88 protein [Hymenobacter psychrotolerans]SHL77770.1 unsaturated rhamnogalacturonyl hydrolase [Hymenobacter psychrotolerans DSM 18569]